jgi:hypothetical protein
VVPETPQLDAWLPAPAVRVVHRREAIAAPERLWEAAQSLRLSETSLLGRLVRWRIPGVAPETRFDELFRNQPFTILSESRLALVSGLVGRIWTLRRDYPQLQDPHEFLSWSKPGTARVLLANWAEPAPAGGGVLRSETRVEAFGAQGRIGLASVRPLIRGFQGLVWSEAMAAAVRRADRA